MRGGPGAGHTAAADFSRGVRGFSCVAIHAWAGHHQQRVLQADGHSKAPIHTLHEHPCCSPPGPCQHRPPGLPPRSSLANLPERPPKPGHQLVHVSGAGAHSGSGRDVGVPIPAAVGAVVIKRQPRHCLPRPRGHHTRPRHPARPQHGPKKCGTLLGPALARGATPRPRLAGAWAWAGLCGCAGACGGSALRGAGPRWACWDRWACGVAADPRQLPGGCWRWWRRRLLLLRGRLQGVEGDGQGDGVAGGGQQALAMGGSSSRQALPAAGSGQGPASATQPTPVLARGPSEPPPRLAPQVPASCRPSPHVLGQLLPGCQHPQPAIRPPVQQRDQEVNGGGC